MWILVGMFVIAAVVWGFAKVNSMGANKIDI